jgi:hypothetical protein
MSYLFGLYMVVLCELAVALDPRLSFKQESSKDTNALCLGLMMSMGKKREIGAEQRAVVRQSCSKLTLHHTFPIGVTRVQNHGYDGTERGYWFCFLEAI